MNFLKRRMIGLLAGFLIISVQCASAGSLPHPGSYIPSTSTIEKYKKGLDDPRSMFDSPLDLKNILPPEILDKVTYDVEKMKIAWPEVVQFKAPEVVGKVAPEIKPGKYTYQDLKKYPGFKELIIPERYDRIKPGEPPHALNIPEFNIIPTRQLYLSLPVAEACKSNMGKTKLDENGYLITDTLAPGIPFPRPSGKFMGNQIVYNWKHRYNQWGVNVGGVLKVVGITKNLTVDYNGYLLENAARLTNRVLMPPYDWYDKRAEKRKEHYALHWFFPSPRDVAGTARTSLTYLNPNTADQNLMYIPSMRRVRKMSATDTQDPVMGQDTIYDDTEVFWQKLSPNKYPYKITVEAREYLVPITFDGKAYVDSKDFAWRNVTMERRPIYRVEMEQQDANYVYGKRVLYIDMETFDLWFTANYDQQGRLYRTTEVAWSFLPEMGVSSYFNIHYNMHDHIDLHTTFCLIWQAPAFWDVRKDMGMATIVRNAK
ncbi:Protein of unknown function [Desulfocicer vacuolatum DSM 3385]|uniref:DUF1329 domain-containing protein n=1 Tax=Desulfocicer vacuolatum DSM 3385 TaxID=1121400 RepID=A0A1W2ETD6_9BACT|nr:DUF1329 domain-containing protein [Desulfocicer vacuolatum]SMD12959.1 Protein of unknown function [Desulfocicer vacuolatum DSM 3385]